MQLNVPFPWILWDIGFTFRIYRRVSFILCHQVGTVSDRFRLMSTCPSSLPTRVPLGEMFKKSDDFGSFIEKVEQTRRLIVCLFVCSFVSCVSCFSDVSCVSCVCLRVYLFVWAFVCLFDCLCLFSFVVVVVVVVVVVSSLPHGKRGSTWLNSNEHDCLIARRRIWRAYG